MQLHERCVSVAYDHREAEHLRQSYVKGYYRRLTYVPRGTMGHPPLLEEHPYSGKEARVQVQPHQDPLGL
jgi:hypothetical protein